MMEIRSAVPGNLFTVDVEEYFQVSAFESAVSREDWDSLDSRVEESVDLLLTEMERGEVIGTFFMLGLVAEKQPALVRRIADAGHEIASHGWWHRRLTGLTPEEFRLEARRSKSVLEELSGHAVHGFRAPSFSIVPGREWAFDVLLEEGYRYDSSLFPIRRRGYGYPSAHPFPHIIRREAGELLELPIATTTWAGMRLPAAGGAYMRLLPFALTQRAFRQSAARGEDAVFYIHPWELDVEQPRLKVPLHARIRHYGGLGRTLPRLRRLLSEFSFTSIERKFGFRSVGAAHRDRSPEPAVQHS